MKTKSSKKKKNFIKNNYLHEAMKRFNNKKEKVISSKELRKSLGI